MNYRDESTAEMKNFHMLGAEEVPQMQHACLILDTTISTKRISFEFTKGGFFNELLHWYELVRESDTP